MKVTNKDVTNKFIEKFEKNKPFTAKQKRLMGIQLAQLRKDTKEYLNEINIETDQSINEILLDCVEYCSMIGRNYRSIASLGYGDLPKSINYWKQRRKTEKEQEEAKLTYSTQENEFYTKKSDNNIEKVIIKSYNKDNNKKTPQWLDDSW